MDELRHLPRESTPLFRDLVWSPSPPILPDREMEGDIWSQDRITWDLPPLPARYFLTALTETEEDLARQKGAWAIELGEPGEQPGTPWDPTL